MSSHPSKIARFWQELKRRRVIHVITVYASAAFVLIELVNNLTEPLNLPPGMATIVIIVLAVGFPLAIVLSWIYDLTGEGMKRTKPIEEVSDKRAAKVPNAWKIATYVSFIVIVGLLTFNIIGGSKGLRAGDIQSLVILPFENFTGDDQLDNMVAGMHSLLIGDMGRVSGLRVIGKTSSRMYRNAEKSATDIAKELNVDGVVEATVTCLGEDVCMQFRLINTSGKEEQVWVGDYSEDKEEIINLYNQITRQIAEEVKVELTPQERRLLTRSQRIDREALDAYLRSGALWDDLHEESLRKAIDFLNKAVEKEPDWAPIYVGLAQTWGALLQIGAEPPQTGMPKVFGYLERAMELDPDYAGIHFNKAIFGTWLEWDWEKGEREFQEAIALNPSDAMSRIYYAHLLGTLQRNEEAQMQGRLAAELEPLDPLIQSLYAVVYTFSRDWKAALDQIDIALELYPGHYFATQLSDVIAYHLGDYDRIIPAFRDYLDFPESFFDSIQILLNNQGIDAVYERVVQEMIDTGYGVTFDYSVRYSLLKDYEKALDWLEIGYEMHDPNMPYLTTGFASFDSIYEHPRFQAIVENMNLPLPVTE